MNLIVGFICMVNLFSLIKSKRSEEEKFGGQKHCRRENRLIRLKRVGEVQTVLIPLGESCLLFCKFCEAKQSREPRIWSFQNLTNDVTTELDFESASLARMRQTKELSLIIKNIQESDTGLYTCHRPYEDSLESSFSFLVDTVKNDTLPAIGSLEEWDNFTNVYYSPANEKLMLQHFLLKNSGIKVRYSVLFSWSAWSACEECVKNPQQFRSAFCRVRPICSNDTCAHLFNNTNTENWQDGSRGIAELLLQTSTQLACRGSILKKYLPTIAEIVEHIPDFVQPAFCAATCPLGSRKSGPEERRLLTLNVGGSASVFCPSISPALKTRWEYNGRRINEGLFQGHVKVDHFGTLYLADAEKNMKGNYTCFSQDDRVLELKVRVHRRNEMFAKAFFRHFRYLTIVIAICYIIFWAAVLVMCCRRRKRKERFGWRLKNRDNAIEKQRLLLEEEDTTEYDNFVNEESSEYLSEWVEKSN